MKRSGEQWEEGEQGTTHREEDESPGLGWDGEWPPDLEVEELLRHIDRQIGSEHEPDMEDRVDRELEARADLTPQQVAGIDLLHALFPRGFVFCTPENRDQSQVPEEQRNHILYTHVNIERMWGALYGHFERGDPGEPTATGP